MNIVIVGGGTAGWLTALYAKKIFNNDIVTLIESEEFGILGAGEGATGQFIEFLNFLEIPISSLINETYTTIKNGIKFSNWSSKNNFYYHPFANYTLASNDSINYSFFNYYENSIEYSHVYSSLNNHETKDYVFMEKVSEQFKVPFSKKMLPLLGQPIDPIYEYDVLGSWSIHFDANLFAKFLRRVGEDRGIVRKEGIVKNIIANENNEICQLQTQNEILNCDFVFDCTGFRRLIIGNFYNSKWHSHGESLPAKKAIPFFLEQEKEIPPYTEAIAMKYGWSWKIPLQHRYGCGYVFDSNFISDEDAKREVDNMLGFEVHSPRTFSFNAGCYEKIWIKNCIAIGLSSGFIEPLEATSILQSFRVLQKFFSDKKNIVTKNQLVIEKFNQMFLNETQEVVDFLYLHYITKRKDTDFWKNFTQNNKMPEFIKYILEISSERFLSDSIDFSDKKIFSAASYYYVMLGNEIVSKNKLKEFSKYLTFDKSVEYFNVLRNQEILLNTALNHREFLNSMKV